MLKSINQPWAISDKYANRYGNTWTNLDFVFEDKISEENFKTDPMNCTIGTLHVAGQKIAMRYKDLISYSKAMETFTNNMYASRPTKNDVFSIDIKGRNLLLLKHEVAKLNETISEAYQSTLRGYELGLYL
jgi:hypothetical protein